VVALAFVASMFEGCLARDEHQLGNIFGRIGVAITITADPAEGMEGPAVLMESLVQAMLSSSYTVDYIAIVHPSVSQVNRKRLEQIGWRCGHPPLITLSNALVLCISALFLSALVLSERNCSLVVDIHYHRFFLFFHH
jgi:hypothetical protein